MSVVIGHKYKFQTASTPIWRNNIGAVNNPCLTEPVYNLCLVAHSIQHPRGACLLLQFSWCRNLGVRALQWLWCKTTSHLTNSQICSADMSCAKHMYSFSIHCIITHPAITAPGLDPSTQW